MRSAKVRRVIIVGFDKASPAAVEFLMAEGKLPNLERLRLQGGYRRLRNPGGGDSSGVWSAFATGARDPYGPESFWTVLGRQFVESTILFVPGTYPPTPFHGRILTVPPPRSQPITWQIAGDHLEGKLASAGTDVPFRVTGLRDRPRLCIEGNTYALNPDDFSPWIPIGKGPDRGIVKFRTTATQIAATAVQVDPEHPDAPISHPAGYAPYLAKLLGPFGADEDEPRETWREREAIFFSALDRQKTGLIACVFNTQGDVDELVGNTLDRAGGNAAVFVVSGDPEEGVLFSNRKLAEGDPAMEDLAATALGLFGVELPERMGGKPVGLLA